MRALLAISLLILANFAIEIPTAGPQVGAQAEGKTVLAQRFCPNRKC